WINAKLQGIQHVNGGLIVKAGWHHTDHREWPVAEQDLFPDHVRRSSERTLPKTIADHSYSRTVRCAFFRCVAAADSGLNADHFEEVCGAAFDANPFGE